MKVMIKAETSTRTELQKIAGEIQSKEGGSVTLSDATKKLIAFYRANKKEAS